MINYLKPNQKVDVTFGLLLLPLILFLSVAGAQTIEPGQDGLSSEDYFDSSGSLVADHQALVGAQLLSIEGVDGTADLDALIRVSEGETWFSLDTTVSLPGNLLAMPGDLVSYAGASYSTVFDASESGIPDGVNLDAAAANYGGSGAMALSFDTTVSVNGLVADDEDLLLWDGSAFTQVIDLSETGVVEGLDLDSAHYDAALDLLIVSFDGSGTLAGLNFNDEDLVAWSVGGSAWSAVAGNFESVGDVNAYWAAPSDLIFASGTE